MSSQEGSLTLGEILDMTDNEIVGNVPESEEVPLVELTTSEISMELAGPGEGILNESVSLPPAPDSTSSEQPSESPSSTTQAVITDDAVRSGDPLPDFRILLRRERINQRMIMTRTVTLTHTVRVTPQYSVRPNDDPTAVVAPPAPMRLLPQSIKGWAGFAAQRLAAPWRPSRPRKVIKHITWAVPLPKRRD